MDKKMQSSGNDTEVLTDDMNKMEPPEETAVSDVPVKAKRVLFYCLMGLLFILSVMMIIILLEGDR